MLQHISSARGAHASLLILVMLTPRALAQNTAVQKFLDHQVRAVVHLETRKVLPNGMTAQYRGTGFVVSSDGLVLTALHVVAGDPPEDGATFQYGGSLGGDGDSRVTLSLLRSDSARDLALLKIDTAGTYATFTVASAKGVRTTDRVLALGFPVSATAVVPVLGEVTETTRTDGRWVIDAPVNPGHSGGPVVRRDGSVIGVVQAGISGLALVNLMLPLKEGDAIFRDTTVRQSNRDWPPVAAPTTKQEIPLNGSCGDRPTVFERSDARVFWKCAEREVPNGVKANVEIVRTVRVTLPASAEVLDIRYFHRSREDWHNPNPFGPWHTNGPDQDLQWMEIGRAEIVNSGETQVVEADCRNWSAELRMFCAIGVQYRADAWLW